MTLLEKLSQDIRSSGANIFELVLVQNGEWQTETFVPTCPCQCCYSVTKNFIATGIGILCDRGQISLDDPVTKFFENELPVHYDEKLTEMTVRHLLTQTSGHEDGFLFEKDRGTHGHDWLAYTLAYPVTYQPGTRFMYSNATYHLLSCIIHRVTGLTAEWFIRKELFEPIGIVHYAWESCPMGETQGGTGLYLSTKDMAKIGVLYLNNGVYDGKRLLSEEWVKEATKDQVAGLGVPPYGYSFWPYPEVEGYAGNGAYQQKVLVVPKHNLVLAAHAFVPDYDYNALLLRALND